MKNKENEKYNLLINLYVYVSQRAANKKVLNDELLMINEKTYLNTWSSVILNQMKSTNVQDTYSCEQCRGSIYYYIMNFANSNITDNGSIISPTEHYFISGHSVTEHLEPSWKTTFSILFGVISFFATISNIVVLKTLHQFQELQTKSNQILAALAVTDMVSGMVLGPINVFQFLNKDPRFVIYIYNIRTFLSTILVLTSDNIAAFISLDRCFHIRKFQDFTMKSRTMYMVLTLCWVIPIATLSVLLIDGPTLLVYLVNVEVAITLLILITFYATLIFALHRFSARNESLKNDSYLRNQANATKTVIVIITLYILMKLPVLVSFLFVVTDRYSLAFRAKFYTIANFICISNSFVNPLVYGYRTLRTDIKKMFPFKTWIEKGVPPLGRLLPFIISNSNDTEKI